jgi:hypothetical protein
MGEFWQIVSVPERPGRPLGQEAERLVCAISRLATDEVLARFKAKLTAL